jgi:translation elongation factor EF-1beta
MGKVATLFKVYAEDADSVFPRIKKDTSPTSIQMEEIGFGIKVIKVMYVHEDSEGSTQLEEKLRKVEGVKDVEVEEESLI